MLGTQIGSKASWPLMVTNLTCGSGKALYEKLYCARGQAESHIEALKSILQPIALPAPVPPPTS